RAGFSTSGRISPSASGRSGFRCSCCGEMWIRSAPSPSAGASPSYFPGPSWSSSRAQRTTWRWNAPPRSLLTSTGTWRRDARSSSVGLADEDEGGPLHDRRARAHERDVDVLHLTLAGPARRLKRALDDVPEAVDASG